MPVRYEPLFSIQPSTALVSHRELRDGPDARPEVGYAEPCTHLGPAFRSQRLLRLPEAVRPRHGLAVRLVGRQRGVNSQQYALRYVLGDVRATEITAQRHTLGRNSVNNLLTYPWSPVWASRMRSSIEVRWDTEARGIAHLIA